MKRSSPPSRSGSPMNVRRLVFIRPGGAAGDAGEKRLVNDKVIAGPSAENGGAATML